MMICTAATTVAPPSSDEAWGAPMRMAAAQMRNLALEVVTELFAQIATSYPILREAFQGAASTILEEAEEECTKVLEVGG